MKLLRLDFGEPVVVPGGADRGSGLARGDLRDESCFLASEGWDIHRVERGVFTLHREGMPHVLTIETDFAGYIPEPPKAAPGLAQGKKR